MMGLVWQNSWTVAFLSMDSPFSSSSPLSTPSSGGPARPAVTPASFLQLLPVLPVAILIGIVYHFIAQYLDLLILFPLVVGACVGGVLASLAKKHKVRSKFVLCAFAIAGGLLSFGARWAGDAFQAREEFISSSASQLSNGNAALEAKAQTFLRNTYPPAKFLPLYLQAVAKQGMTISSHGSSSSNAPITGTAFWVFVLADALIMCGTATAIAWGQATSPFCLGCDSWYGTEMTVSRLHLNQAGEAANMAKSGNWTGLGELRSEGATEKSYCDVLLSKCPSCSTGKLTVKSRSNNSVKTLWSNAVSPADTRKLEEVRAQWLQ